MSKSPLFGRRIHIAGSITEDPNIAKTEDIKQAREFVELLVKVLLQKGANFVLPVDAEKIRQVDGLPICFDWLIWETISKNLASRPNGSINPLAIAVQHYKNEEQIPDQFTHLWDNLRSSDLVKVENAAHWNMASKRMEVQARCGDILLTLGGSEGVLFLANLYHDAGKPIIPLNFKLCPQDTGSRKLFDYGLIGNYTQHLFQTEGLIDPHNWINRINFSNRINISERVSKVIDLLEDLERPKAFVIRLLNPKHDDYKDVQDFFDTIVQPIVEGEMRYQLVVIDGKQPYEYARVDQEIFTKLHRSSIVIADITGYRPNCFLELGYAFGRGLPTMLLGKEGIDHPFDIISFSGHHWKTTGTVDERRHAFREHYQAIQNRPPLVPVEPLIP
jgi:hypothetical protein